MNKEPPKFLSNRNLLLVILLFGSILLRAQENKYSRLLDSARAYSFSDHKKMLVFLDSIPNPEGGTIEDELIDYYILRAHATERLDQIIESHKYYLLALKIADQNKEYDYAGEICQTIFIQRYKSNMNQEALVYLEKAKEYYTKSNNAQGLLELKFQPGALKFFDKNYEASIALILENLQEYQSSKDKYLYALATYMLASNYLNLNDLDKGLYYFEEFQKLEGAEGVSDFSFYQSEIFMGLADFYDRQGNPDLALSTLLKIGPSQNEMYHIAKKRYYKILANTYNLKGDSKKSLAYIDSLVKFTDSINSTNRQAGFENAETLLYNEENLEETKIENRWNKGLISLLGLAIGGLLYFLYRFIRYKRLKEKRLENDLTKSTYLNENSEKLAAKVTFLETYIQEQKEEIKKISKISDIKEQREKILELHKKAHIESQNVLAVGEDQLTVINRLNVDFFKKLKETHPKLNESDSLICYYLFMGFKNKEIALMLNLTLRSVESKRYRLVKKLNIDTSQTTLVEYLKKEFKSTN